MNLPTTNNQKRTIIEGARQCVACGLCLPWCPTYQLEKTESESPRGRLFLLQAIAQAELTDPDAAMELLGHCLLCRSCEKHCPSSVPFGDVMDAGRSLAAQPRSLLHRLSRSIAGYALRRPEWIRRTGRLAAIFRCILPAGFISLARRNAALKGLQYHSFVQSHSGWHTDYPSRTYSRGQIDLFLGCVTRMLDAQTIDDTIELMTLQGYEVHIPSRQACCGALSLHHGRIHEATDLMQRNLAAFGGVRGGTIVHMATGCGATLSEYGRHLPDSLCFADRITEICAFIDQNWDENCRISRADMTVMLHSPCTLQNCLPETDAPASLLGRIPGINLIMLDSGYGCCGAAGTNMLTRPDTAAALRSPLIDQIVHTEPDAVATTNPGCALHLQEGLQKAGLGIPVLHPVSILLNQISATDSDIIPGPSK